MIKTSRSSLGNKKAHHTIEYVPAGPRKVHQALIRSGPEKTRVNANQNGNVNIC